MMIKSKRTKVRVRDKEYTDEVLIIGYLLFRLLKELQFFLQALQQLKCLVSSIFGLNVLKRGLSETKSAHLC